MSKKKKKERRDSKYKTKFLSITWVKNFVLFKINSSNIFILSYTKYGRNKRKEKYSFLESRARIDISVRFILHSMDTTCCPFNFHRVPSLRRWCDFWPLTSTSTRIDHVHRSTVPRGGGYCNAHVTTIATYNKLFMRGRLKTARSPVRDPATKRVATRLIYFTSYDCNIIHRDASRDEKNLT